ncbi:HNH endonuclease, partial [Marinococcus halophilus]
QPIIFQQTQQWPRNAAIAAEAIHRADYQCEYDNSLPFFISKQTQRPFMEAHHLIPMQYQNMFEVSLDRVENIVCLSPHAHRMIHHAIDEEKEKILANLFEKRKDRLQQVGIDLTYQEVKAIYHL